MSSTADGGVETCVSDDAEPSGAAARSKRSRSASSSCTATIDFDVVDDAAPVVGDAARRTRRGAKTPRAMADGNGYVLFVWSPAGLRDARDATASSPQLGQEFEDGDRTLVISKIGASPLPGDARAVRLLRRQVLTAAAAQPRGVLGRRQAEHERLREPARVAAGRDAARVDAGRPEAVDGEPSSRSTRARSSTRRPPIVCVIDAITRTAATAPGGRRRTADRRARPAPLQALPRPSRATVRSRTRSRECLARPAGSSACAPRLRAVACTTFVSDHDTSRGVEELDAVLVEDPREPRVQLRERDELRLVPWRVGHVAAVELVRCRPSARRRGRARDRARRPATTGSRAAAATPPAAM